MSTPRTDREFREAELAWLQRGGHKRIREEQGDCIGALVRAGCFVLLSAQIIKTTAAVQAADYPSLLEDKFNSVCVQAGGTAPATSYEIPTPQSQSHPAAAAATATVAAAITSARKGTAGNVTAVGDSTAQAASTADCLRFLESYIADCNSQVEAAHVAALLTEAGTAGGVDPLLLAAIARYESGFRTGATGAAGERGLLQIHPCHRRSMARAGLDFGSEADRLAFGCQLYHARGLRPWAVRSKARAEYKRILEVYLHDGPTDEPASGN